MKRILFILVAIGLFTLPLACGGRGEKGTNKEKERPIPAKK